MLRARRTTRAPSGGRPARQLTRREGEHAPREAESDCARRECTRLEDGVRCCDASVDAAAPARRFEQPKRGARRKLGLHTDIVLPRARQTCADERFAAAAAMVVRARKESSRRAAEKSPLWRDARASRFALLCDRGGGARNVGIPRDGRCELRVSDVAAMLCRFRGEARCEEARAGTQRRLGRKSAIVARESIRLLAHHGQ
jgi:hypothetical protein